MAPSLKTSLIALGAVAALSITQQLASFAWLFIRTSSFSRYTTTANGSPPWAFITGASSGIGAAFAFELASRGFNIVIHGRNQQKLKSVKKAVQARYPGCEVRVVIADAADPSKVDFPGIAASVADIQIKVLINNVGATMPLGHYFDTLENYSAQELLDNVGANATFPLLLTGALLPNLIKDQPGLILNVGSFSDNGMPLFPSYGPAKAFVRNSCVELGMEMAFKERDIEVLGLTVVQVTDTGVIFVPSSYSVPSGPTWVKSALARVGCGRPHVVPYLPHALQVAVLENLPDWISKQAKLAVSASMLVGDPTGRLAHEAAVGEDSKKNV
ncbi:hypothetical protein FZEAL_3480 [Fusarium zealandicum]|uniref:NAD(P)-binding protein n=1 Tax=Fusarium zealandicum TaxID=1053134 RepID=A0A8H4UNQ8_9HYPO|nr:hypothetical protein FZEAL_3480 [Fusarium zealandicum]